MRRDVLIRRALRVEVRVERLDLLGGLVTSASRFGDAQSRGDQRRVVGRHAAAQARDVRERDLQSFAGALPALHERGRVSVEGDAAWRARAAELEFVAHAPSVTRARYGTTTDGEIRTHELRFGKGGRKCVTDPRMSRIPHRTSY